MNEIPKIVFSKTLDDVDATWPTTRVARGDLATEIAAIKAEPGPDVIVWGGAGFAGALAAADLIDEYRLFIQPLVVGRGQGLFAQLAGSRHLNLVEAMPQRHRRAHLSTTTHMKEAPRCVPGHLTCGARTRTGGSSTPRPA